MSLCRVPCLSPRHPLFPTPLSLVLRRRLDRTRRSPHHPLSSQLIALACILPLSPPLACILFTSTNILRFMYLS